MTPTPPTNPLTTNLTATNLTATNLTATSPMTTGSKPWLRMRAIAKRHAYVLVRSPHRLFDVTLWPLVDVILFGSLAAFVGTSGSTSAAKASGYLLAGIVLWHVIYQSQIAMSTGLPKELSSVSAAGPKRIVRSMATPLRLPDPACSDPSAARGRRAALDAAERRVLCDRRLVRPERRYGADIGHVVACRRARCRGGEPDASCPVFHASFHQPIPPLGR